MFSVLTRKSNELNFSKMFIIFNKHYQGKKLKLNIKNLFVPMCVLKATTTLIEAALEHGFSSPQYL